MNLPITSRGDDQGDNLNYAKVAAPGPTRHRSQSLVIFLTLVAACGVALAIYAFEQKKEANMMTRLALQQRREALQQLNIHIGEEISKDTNTELVLRQKELANESERKAIEQQKKAEDEAIIALTNELEAKRQSVLAEQRRLESENQKGIAEKEAGKAAELTVALAQSATDKEIQKRKAFELLQKTKSRKLANESILLFNANYFDSSLNKALEAFSLNSIYNGPHQNNDIYKALNMNWAKSINYKNVSSFHFQPVHCITGIPGNDIIFTADESGKIFMSLIKDGAIHNIASNTIDGKVRSLAVSPDGKKLVAITSTGTGTVFNISTAGFAGLTTFRFSGIGKALFFNNNEIFELLSTEGIGQYTLAPKVTLQIFIARNGINAFVMDKSGSCYVALSNDLKTYKNWNELVKDIPSKVQKFESQVSIIAVDAEEQYIAAGTNNGFVWINKLRKDNTIPWSGALHLSVVKDLIFIKVDNGGLQLASAGADQTIKLIDVEAVLQQNTDEDIITLHGHSKWIWKMYYTPVAHQLFSTGEDNRVITWQPSMAALYKSLNH